MREAGEEPDARFTSANERAFLAWFRTALTLAAGGAALHALSFLGPAWLHGLLLGGVICAFAFVRGRVSRAR